MEAIGLVLGVIPIVVSALQSYKAGKTFKSRVQNRKGHIAELVRALKGYQAALEGYLEWVLKGAGVELDQVDNVENVSAVLADPAVVEDVKDFLGTSAANALFETLETCLVALSEISCSINELLPESGPTADPHVNVKFLAARYAASKEITIWKGIKLAFSKTELDAQIQRIDRCTGLLDKLQSNRTAIGQLEGTEPTRKSRHVVRALNKIGRHAEQLHQALKSGWAPDCHETHEVGLFLEERLQGSRSRPKKTDVHFRLIFAGGEHHTSLLWHDSHVHVHVLDEEQDTIPDNRSSTKTGRAPKVAIFAPPTDPKPSTTMTRRQLQNICLCITEAQRSQLHLEMYLLSQSVLHYSHLPATAPKAVKGPAIVNLQQLIVTASTAHSRSDKLPLMSRLRLALVLASTTLQLGSTSWLKRPWSKDTVYFIHPASSTPGVASATSSVQLSIPTLREQFPGPSSSPQLDCKQNGARVVLLELGIILLELWNEITIEQHYAGTNTVVRKDYFNRLSLAQQWLEDSQLDILPAYYDAIARLVKCHFDGIPVNPLWDNQNLQCGLVKCVIEPLQRQCKVDT